MRLRWQNGVLFLMLWPPKEIPMARDTYETKDELDAPQTQDGLGNALVILTTLLLLVAFILIQKGMGDRYGAGMLADKTAAVPGK